MLTPAELNELNDWIDRHEPWTVIAEMEGQRSIRAGTTEHKLHIGPTRRWGEPFRRLINHPKVMPHLVEMVGEKLRLDHEYAIFMNEGGEELRLHGGSTPYNPDQFYHCYNGKMYNGLTVASFALTDVEAGGGGFCTIPGSHKSSFECPDDCICFQESGPWLKHVPQRAGSVLFFTEALTHGTLPWKSDRQRRSLLFKYSPGHASWAQQHTVDVPEASWSEGQLRLQRPPYKQERESVM